jgi:hypothetical protein
METIMYIALTVTAIAMAWMNYEYWKLNGYLKEMSIELENNRSHYEVVVIKRSKETEKILKNANLENKRSTLSFVTINQIVESILAQDGNKTKLKRNANEATIILKTAMIYEARGIDEAMRYYNGTHSEDEYQEYRTSAILTV